MKIIRQRLMGALGRSRQAAPVERSMVVNIHGKPSPTGRAGEFEVDGTLLHDIPEMGIKAGPLRVEIGHVDPNGTSWDRPTPIGVNQDVARLAEAGLMVKLADCRIGPSGKVQSRSALYGFHPTTTKVMPDVLVGTRWLGYLTALHTGLAGVPRDENEFVEAAVAAIASVKEQGNPSIFIAIRSPDGSSVCREIRGNYLSWLSDGEAAARDVLASPHHGALRKALSSADFQVEVIPATHFRWQQEGAESQMGWRLMETLSEGWLRGTVLYSDQPKSPMPEHVKPPFLEGFLPRMTSEKIIGRYDVVTPFTPAAHVEAIRKGSHARSPHCAPVEPGVSRAP